TDRFCKISIHSPGQAFSRPSSLDARVIPSQHTRLALALVALLQGTATLLHSVDIHKKFSRDFRHACISACEALIHEPRSGRLSHRP
ncbi:MAG TPA: hypothetical protein VKA81_01940, partial [Verrucomicrobiae bacterium]|nr:hypothetical protein [Verrucomicrobiae bacterium]